jgi:flagellar basal-body rod protein FlgB
MNCVRPGGERFSPDDHSPAHYNGGGQGIESIRPRVEIDRESSIRIDGNTVNIDQEMVELAKNSGRFAQLAELLNRQYGQIKAAISGNLR